MLHTKYRFSVIIPVRNEEQTIHQCITSLLSQKYKAHQIIVIDNRSTDNTQKILREHSNRIVHLQENKPGSYAARNKGIDNAKGDIIAFLDGDCVPDRNWLYNLNKAFQDNGIEVVGGKIRALYANTTLDKFCDKYSHEQHIFCKAKKPFFATANMAIRANFLKNNKFNETLLSGGDVELCQRIITSRKQIRYLKEAIVYHKYELSLMAFMRKQYFYGKWSTCRSEISGLKMDFIQILKNHGLAFFILRLLQSASYRIGILHGRVSVSA